MMRQIKLFGKLWTPSYEDNSNADDDGGNKNDGGGKSDKNGTGEITFTSEQQEHINKLLAAEKREGQEKLKIKISEIETLTKKTNLTVKERKQLEERLKSVKTELMTKEELDDQARTKMVTEHREEVETLTTDRDSWRTRYSEATISRSLTDAAVTNDAISPEQIVSIVRQNTRLVEVIDKDGKTTDTYKPVVSIKVTKDGEEKTLELSPTEAVKQMKEDERFYNLFKGDGTGGVNKNNRGAPSNTDIKELAKNPEAYRKARNEGKITGLVKPTH